jgi:hypothetical protein
LHLIGVWGWQQFQLCRSRQRLLFVVSLWGLQPEGQPILQGGVQTLVFVLALVERDQADGYIDPLGQAFALQVQLPRVERRRQAGGGFRWQSLGHGQQQQAPAGLAEQSGSKNGAAAGQGGRQIQATEELAITDARRHASQRRVGSQQGFESVEPGLAPGMRAAAQAGATEPLGVDGEQGGGQRFILGQQGLTSGQGVFG